MLGAIRQPADRAPEPLRRLENERIFAVDDRLGAEAAADVLGDDAKRLRRNFENRLGDDSLEDVHALASDIERQAAGCRIVFADARERGSMKLATTRGLTILIRTVCAARAKAASVSCLSPMWVS